MEPNKVSETSNQGQDSNNLINIKDREGCSRIGSALAKALEEKSNNLNLSQKETARTLGLSYPYYTLLLSGERWFGSLPKEKLTKIAVFLGISIVSVYMLAEVLEISDFQVLDNIDFQLNNAFKTMQNDRRYTIALPTPAKWHDASLEMKLCVIMLYQSLSNKDLLEKFKLIEVYEPDNGNLTTSA